jgi:hypothetical protein
MSAAEIILATGTAPTDPASGKVSLYTKTDNILYYRDSAGNEVALGALPNAHASTHESGGSDALALGSIAGTIDDTQHGTRGGGTLHSAATTSTAGFMSAADKAALDALGVLPNRNALINGSFAIWQRQADPATAAEYADDEYCADRWYVLTQSNPIDAERIDGDTQRYAIRLTQKNATAQQLGLAQIIEGVNCQHLRGQEVTFLLRAQCSAAETVNVAVLEWGGTEDSVTSDVAASWSGSGLPTLAAGITQAGSTGQTALSVSTWADVLTTVTLGSSFTNLIIFVWSDTTLAQNVTLDLEAAQLERGGVATPFEVRPVGAELALCQRYFERRTTADQFHTLPGSAGLITTTTRGEIPFVYAEKRGAPSLSTVNAFDLFAATGGFVSSLTFAFISARGCRIRATTTSTTYTEGQACYLRAEGVGGAALDIDAEL